MIYATYDQFRVGFATTTDIDITGRREWPVDKLQQAFSFEFPGTYIINPLGQIIMGVSSVVSLSLQYGATFPWEISMNGGQADAVAGTHEWDWYLSQHTDDSAKQYLELQNTDTDPVVDVPDPKTVSGRVKLALTSLGTSTFGSTLSPAKLSRLFDGVYLYTQRKSDDAIWMFDIKRVLFTPNLPS